MRHNILVGLGFLTALSALLVGPSRVEASIILAENVHVDGETAGNNPYDFPDTYGAENFVLTGLFDITRISHVGHHQPGNAQPTSIDWRIYADAAGLPGALLASANAAPFSTAVEGTAFGGFYDLTRYLIDISPVTLSPGVYWVAFHNNGVYNSDDPTSSDPHWTFASSGTSFDGISAISTNGGATWTVPYPGSNMTFRVEGELAQGVPEPASLTLLGIGAFGMIGHCWRRRKYLDKA